MNPLRCPTCRKTGDWFAGPWGPFCSERCRLVDLGKWLGEEHVIGSSLRPEHFLEGEEDLSPPPPPARPNRPPR